MLDFCPRSSDMIRINKTNCNKNILLIATQLSNNNISSLGCRMVHEQDLAEDCPVSPKKRSYPFIYWTQSTNSSPPRDQRSPERSSPSPPHRPIKTLTRPLKSDWRCAATGSSSSNYQVRQVNSLIQLYWSDMV